MAAKITQENLGCWRLSCSLALSAHIPTCFLHVAYSPPCMYDIHSLQLSLNTQRLAWLRWGDTQILGSRWSAWYQVHLLYLPYRPCFPVHERKYHRKFRQCLGMLSQSLYRAEVAMGEAGPTGAGWLFGRTKANKAAASHLYSWIKPRGTSQKSPVWKRSVL